MEKFCDVSISSLDIPFRTDAKKVPKPIIKKMPSASAVWAPLQSFRLSLEKGEECPHFFGHTCASVYIVY